MVAEKENLKERIEKVLELVREWERVSHEEQPTRLRAFGYDPDELAAEGVSFVGEILEGSLKEEREAARHARLLAEKNAKLVEEQNETLSEAEVDAALKEIIVGNFGKAYQQQVALHMRNFREATRDDKLRLLHDLRVLKKMLELKGEGDAS